MNHSKKGSSLIWVIVICAFLAILAAGLSASIVSETKLQVRQKQKTQAYYIGRAGAAATAKWITSMSDSDTDDLNSLTFPLHSKNNSFGKGKYDITVTKDSNTLTITSTGKVPDGTNPDGSTHYITDVVTDVLGIGGSSTFNITTAVYAKNTVLVDGSSTVTGALGTGSTSTASVMLNGNPTVTGSIVLPPGCSESTSIQYPSNPHYIHNTIQFGTCNYPDPILPSFPDSLINMGSIWQHNGCPPLYINANAKYDQIKIANSAEIIINTVSGDNVIRIGELDLQDGIISITGPGKLIMYVDKITNIKSYINYGGDKNKLIIYCGNSTSNLTIADYTQIVGSLYCGSTNLDIEGSAAIWGDITTSGSQVKIAGHSHNQQVLYAPNADISVEGSGAVLGGVVGNNVKLTGNVSVSLSGGSISNITPITTGSTKHYSQSHWK